MMARPNVFLDMSSDNEDCAEDCKSDQNTQSSRSESPRCNIRDTVAGPVPQFPPPLAPGNGADHRRKRSKVLQQALRRSREIRLSREIAPNPHLLPAVENINGAHRSGKAQRNNAKRLSFLSIADDDKVSGYDEEDWAIFISSGYANFPLPPNMPPSRSSTKKSVQQGRVPNRYSTRLSVQSRRGEDPLGSFLEPSSPPSSRLRPTGVDWLDDELAWVSSDDEREELTSAATPPEHPAAKFESPTLGMNSSPSLGAHRFAHRYTKSSSSDVFSTPTASPQVDDNLFQSRKKNSMKAVGRANIPSLAGLADAISRYAAEATGAPSIAEESDPEQADSLGHAADEEQIAATRAAAAKAMRSASKACSSTNKHMSSGSDRDDFLAAIMAKHSSLSSAASSNASSGFSREFSIADSLSTRPSSANGASDCGTSDVSSLAAFSPQKNSKTYSNGSDGLHIHHSDKSGKTHEHASRNSHLRNPSDVSSAHSSRRSRRSRRCSSRLGDNSAPPVAPTRSASLEINRRLSISNYASGNVAEPNKQQPAAAGAAAARPLLGAWLMEDEGEENVPAHQRAAHELFDNDIREQARRASVVAFNTPNRRAAASASQLDLSTDDFESGENRPSLSTLRSGKRSFSRQRRGSISALFNGPSDNGSSSSVATIKATHLTSQARRNMTLRERIMSKVSKPRPSAHDPIMPVSDPDTSSSIDTQSMEKKRKQSAGLTDESPSMQIFGSAALAPDPEGRPTIRRQLSIPKVAFSTLRQNGYDDSAIPPMPGHPSLVDNRGPSRSPSMRSRARSSGALKFDCEPDSTSLSDETFGKETQGTTDTSRMSLQGHRRPPVSSWRHGQRITALLEADRIEKGESGLYRGSLDETKRQQDYFLNAPLVPPRSPRRPILNGNALF